MSGRVKKIMELSRKKFDAGNNRYNEINDENLSDNILSGKADSPSSNVSSDLNEEQMAIANEVEAIIGDNLNFMHSYAEQDLNSIQSSMDTDFEPFGSDYSDIDPTYDPPQSILHNNIEYEVDVNGEDTRRLVLVILDEVLTNVWKKVKNSTRKRKRQVENWKKTINKKRRSDGLSYITKKKLQPPKIPKSINCSKCKYKCNDNFTEEIRNRLCRTYWKMDFVAKKNFILANVTKQPVKTRTVLQKTDKRLRNFSTKCFFSHGDKKIHVCQNFFLTTLCVSKATLLDACIKTNEVGMYNFEDKRGKHMPSNKTSPEAISLVKQHIESFPVMESHYTRRDTKKQYLDCNLTINKMYYLYQEMCEKLKANPVSANIYRNVFCDDYNLSFFKPKKDQCPTCTKYANADKEKKSMLESDYSHHRQRHDDCMKAKALDKARASVEKEFISVTLDLQSVLQIPSGAVSQLYYSRKLVLYNLVIYESALPNNVYCICWSEVNGKKGSCEIGSCIYYYLSNCIPDYVHHITMFSDTCSGQNRNQYVAAMLLWTVQKLKNIHTIEQKFLESGHSYMECDSVHSAIEYTSKNCSIYSVNEWKNIFLQSRRKQTKTINDIKHTILPYNVKELKYNDILDLKTLAAKLIRNRTIDDDNNIVHWLKIKRLKYIKGNPQTIFFNYDMSDTFKSLTITTGDVMLQDSPSIRTRKQSTKKSKIEHRIHEFPNIISPAYKSQLPISNAKKKDLLKLCKNEVIPEEFHHWFKELKSSADILERIPDFDVNDEGEPEDEL